MHIEVKTQKYVTIMAEKLVHPIKSFKISGEPMHGAFVLQDGSDVITISMPVKLLAELGKQIEDYMKTPFYKENT